MEQVYFRGIVFNQSWEDPEMDRQALQIARDRDVVVSVTSGGCNSLNLLCLSPKEIICIDSNPAQTYLMDLKLAGIRQLDYDDFFGFFGATTPERSKTLYDSALRDALPAPARRFWDRNIRLFQKGIYSQGKLGLFLRFVRLCLRSSLREPVIRDFFHVESLTEQREYYATKIAPKIWRSPLLRILNSRVLMYLAGMHPKQYDLIDHHMGIEQFIRARVDHLLTSIPVRTNYFLAQAALGGYLDRESVPPYLLEANFVTLKRNVDRVTNVTDRLDAYLDQRADASIDKFNLLDIFDWMDPTMFRTTLSGVVRVGSEGGRFIYRSTVRVLPPPDELLGMVVGEPDLAADLLQSDRSGLYSSFYVYRICKTGGELEASALALRPRLATEIGTLRREQDTTVG